MVPGTGIEPVREFPQRPKPSIICHRMSSINGRIDCKTTSERKGEEEYYSTLDSLDTPSTLSGKTTVQWKRSNPGVFQSREENSISQDLFSFCNKLWKQFHRWYFKNKNFKIFRWLRNFLVNLSFYELLRFNCASYKRHRLSDNMGLLIFTGGLLYE